MIDTVWYATNPTITTYKRINELTNAKNLRAYGLDPETNTPIPVNYYQITIYQKFEIFIQKYFEVVPVDISKDE